jgi:hypothetical protein
MAWEGCRGKGIWRGRDGVKGYGVGGIKGEGYCIGEIDRGIWCGRDKGRGILHRRDR